MEIERDLGEFEINLEEKKIVNWLMKLRVMRGLYRK